MQQVGELKRQGKDMVNSGYPLVVVAAILLMAEHISVMVPPAVRRVYQPFADFMDGMYKEKIFSAMSSCK